MKTWSIMLGRSIEKMKEEADDNFDRKQSTIRRGRYGESRKSNSQMSKFNILSSVDL